MQRKKTLFYSDVSRVKIIVGTQNMVVGLNLYLGSQSICIVGFGFPIMGGPMLDNLSTLMFPQTLLFT